MCDRLSQIRGGKGTREYGREHARENVGENFGEKLGEFFGFYGFAGKAASILGPMLWGSVVWALDSTHTLKYRIAVSLLLCLVIAAASIFRNFNRNIFLKNLNY